MKSTIYRIICASIFLLGPMAFAQHSVTLTWTAPTAGGQVSGYNVKRGPVGGPYVTIGSPPSAVPFTDSSSAVQAEGSKFGYVVSATGPGGESPNSAEAAVTIPFSPPGTPGAPTAVAK